MSRPMKSLLAVMLLTALLPAAPALSAPSKTTTLTREPADSYPRDGTFPGTYSGALGTGTWDLTWSQGEGFFCGLSTGPPCYPISGTFEFHPTGGKLAKYGDIIATIAPGSIWAPGGTHGGAHIDQFRFNLVFQGDKRFSRTRGIVELTEAGGYGGGPGPRDPVQQTGTLTLLKHNQPFPDWTAWDLPTS